MGKRGKQLLTVGVTFGALLLITFVAFDGQWPSKDDASGAIGAANKYRAEQITEADVVLKDAGIQTLLQNDEFQKLIADKDFQELLSHNDMQQALAHAGFINALAHANTAILRTEINTQPLYGYAGIQSTLAFASAYPQVASDPTLHEKLAYAGVDAAVAYASGKYAMKSSDLKEALAYAGAPQILSFASRHPEVASDTKFSDKLAYAGMEEALAFASSEYAIAKVDLERAFAFAGPAQTLAFASRNPEIASDKLFQEKLAYSGMESALSYASSEYAVKAVDLRSAFGYAGAARVLAFAQSYPEVASDNMMRDKLAYSGIDAAIAYASGAFAMKSTELQSAFNFAGATQALAFSSKYSAMVSDAKFQEALAYSGIDAAIAYASGVYKHKAVDLREAFGFAGAARMVAFMSAQPQLAGDKVFREKLAYAGMEAAMAYASTGLAMKSSDLRMAFGFAGAPQALAFAGEHQMLMKDAKFVETFSHAGLDEAIAYASKKYSLKAGDLQDAFAFAGAAEVLAFASNHQELFTSDAFQNKLSYAGIEAAIAYASSNFAMKATDLRDALSYAGIQQTLAFVGAHPMLMKDGGFARTLAFSGVDAAVFYAESRNISVKSSELREAFGYAGAARVLAFASNYPEASMSEAMGYAGVEKILSFARSNPALASDLGMLMRNSTIQTALAHGNFAALTPDM